MVLTICTALSSVIIAFGFGFSFGFLYILTKWQTKFIIRNFHTEVEAIFVFVKICRKFPKHLKKTSGKLHKAKET